MQNFHNTFGTRKRSFISAFSICLTVPLRLILLQMKSFIFQINVYYFKVPCFHYFFRCKPIGLFSIKKEKILCFRVATVALEKQPLAHVLQKRCSQKFRNVYGKTPVSEYVFNKNFIKRHSNTGFFCEYCEISKNSFFIEHLRWAASGLKHFNTKRQDVA